MSWQCLSSGHSVFAHACLTLDLPDPSETTRVVVMGTWENWHSPPSAAHRAHDDDRCQKNRKRE